MKWQPTSIPRDRQVEVFDLLMNYTWDVSPPTAASIARINAELGIELPPTLVDFARRATKFGAWFCSLGEDYDNFTHILAMNRLFHAGQRGGYKRWRPMPKHLVIFNHGHDDDCDCFDLRLPRSPQGEYWISYWSPGEDDRSLADNFPYYLGQHLLAWGANLHKDRREALRALLEPGP
jgi:hypothetical protein